MEGLKQTHKKKNNPYHSEHLNSNSALSCLFFFNGNALLQESIENFWTKPIFPPHVTCGSYSRLSRKCLCISTPSWYRQLLLMTRAWLGRSRAAPASAHAEKLLEKVGSMARSMGSWWHINNWFCKLWFEQPVQPTQIAFAPAEHSVKF